MLVTNVNSPEAKAILKAGVVAFDIETDTASKHWKANHKRGLSYCTDMTEIAFYDGHHTLLLSAKPVDILFNYEEIDYSSGEAVFQQRSMDSTAYEFDAAQLKYIRRMFTRTDPVTFVAHNLIFDARQVFGKLGIHRVPDTMRLWDTLSIHLLGWEWNERLANANAAAAADEEISDDEDSEESNIEGPMGAAALKAGLLDLYERRVQKLDPGYRALVAFMKGQRKNFPDVELEEMPQSAIVYLPEAVASLISAYQTAILWYKGLSTPNKNIVKKLKTLTDIQEALVGEPDLKGAALRRQNEKIQKIRDISEDTAIYLGIIARKTEIIEQVMPLYVEFDAVAAFEIYQSQVGQTPYEEYTLLLETHITYQRWCVESAAIGVRTDRDLIKTKIADSTKKIMEMCEQLGLKKAEDAKKSVYAMDMLLYGGNLHPLMYGQKNYVKNMKEAAALLPPIQPDLADLKAHQKMLLTKLGRWQLMKILDDKADPRSLTPQFFAYGAKSLIEWIKRYPANAEQVGILAEVKRLIGNRTLFEGLLRESECDGRLHSMFAQLTETGRCNSASPNLQNLHFDNKDPMTDMAGVILPDEGCIFFENDLGTAEKWMQAMVAADDVMALACMKEDFHMAFAEGLWGVEYLASLDKDGRKQKRSQAKSAGFGSDYGMGAETLAAQARITKEEAEAILKLIVQKFPKLAEVKMRVTKYSEDNLWIKGWRGRRMMIDTYIDKRGNLKAKGYAGWNRVAQNGIAEVTVLSINDLRRFFFEKSPRSRVALQIHDSMINSVYVGDYGLVPQICAVVGDCMNGELRRGTIRWVESTVPHVRWLTDVDHSQNSKKWGYQHSTTYPFPLDEYANRWGFHKIPEGYDKAPLWVNEWGWGQKALDAELSGIELQAPTPMVQADGFNWLKLQLALSNTLPLLQPQQYRDKVFTFDQIMLLWAQAERKGEPTQRQRYLIELDTLATALIEYQQWRQSVQKS